MVLEPVGEHTYLDQPILSLKTAQTPWKRN